MKKEMFFLTVIIGFLSLFLILNSCNNETPEEEIPVLSLKYTGADIDGETIEIEIIRPNSYTVFTPGNNDQFKVRKNGNEVSKGVINKNGNALVFKPDSGFVFGGELAGDTMYVPIVHGNSIGIKADTNTDIVSNEFNVTAANFDSIIKSIIDVPGEYVINLSGDLLNYHGININNGVKITIKGTKTNTISWQYNENEPNSLFGVYGGFLVLEDINISGPTGNEDKWPLLCIYNGTIAIKDNVIISNDSGDFNAFDSGVLLKNGAFIMTGGEIKGFHAGIDTKDETSLVITGGRIYNSGGSGVAFTASDAFLVIEGGDINDNKVGIYMEGSSNIVVIKGGTISNNDLSGIDINGSGNMVVITGGTIHGNETGGVQFIANNAFLTIEGGDIYDNDVGIYMGGSSNNVVISGGTISNNDTDGINISGSGNMMTITGGTISGNEDGGIITGGESKNGRVIITGGIIDSNGSGIGFYSSGPSYFEMTGGTIQKSKTAGLYLGGHNSSFEKTGGIIYGKTGLYPNENAAIVVGFEFIGSYDLYVDADDSEIYAATINATGDDLIPDSLQGTGWVYSE